MKNFKELLEANKKDTVVFFFGRCNPPTPAHVLLFGIVVETAKKLNADYNIVISRTQDKKKNPLNISQKLEFLNLQFPSVKFTAANDTMRTPVEVLKYFDKKYKNVVMIVGSDRQEAFQKLFDDYNGKEYNFTSIKVMSAGERDPDGDDISGMSSTKMRASAADSDYQKFKKGLMGHVRDLDGKRMMNDIRVGLGLPRVNESIQFARVDVREKYRAGEIFAEGSYVESNGEILKIINRNSNYLTLVNESGLICKKWLTDVQETTPNESVITKFGEISEMKFNSSDKLKVAKIIGGVLGADIEKSANPEQIVNAGLKIARSKALNDEAKSILRKMLQTADDAGIKYDRSILDKKVEKEEVSEARLSFDDVAAKHGFKKSSNSTSNIHVFKHEDGSDVTVRYSKDGASWKHSNGKWGMTPDSLNGTLGKKVEEATLDKDEDYADFIKRSAEEKHVKGERHITLYKKDQIVADQHHAYLNSLNGPQVQLPTGHSMDAAADTSLGRMKIAYHRHDESVEDSASDGSYNDDYEMSDAEIEQIVMSFQTEEDILDAYDDEELHIVDNEGASHGCVADMPTDNVAAIDEIPPEEVMHTVYAKDVIESTELNEVLTRLDRIKASIRMRIKHPTMERKLKLALVRHSTVKKLGGRAKKLAIKAMKIRLMRKPLNQFTVQDKERAEKMIQKRKAIINRIAMRLMPRIRKLEQSRLSHPAFTKSSGES